MILPTWLLYPAVLATVEMTLVQAALLIVLGCMREYFIRSSDAQSRRGACS